MKTLNPSAVYLKALIEEVLSERDGPKALCVDYEDAGQMIGTTYEGIRKMVRKGQLKATRRGRRCGIAVSELKEFVRRNTH